MSFLDNLMNVVDTSLRTAQQRTGTGLFRRPAPGRALQGDPYDDPQQNIRFFEEQARQREAEEERRRRAEARRRAEERAAAQKALNHGPQKTDLFGIGRTVRSAARDVGTKFEESHPTYRPLINWGKTPEGRQFLTANGATKFDEKRFQRDPEKYLADHPTMREWRWGLDPEDADNLRRIGAPDYVISAMRGYVQRTEGKGLRPIDAGSDPVYDITKEVTGSDFAAGLASGTVGGLTLGATRGLSSAGPGSNASDRVPMGEAVQAVGDSLIFGRLGLGGRAGLRYVNPLNFIEDKAVATAASKFGKNFFTDAAARVLTRAGLNVAEDVPLTAVQLQDAGISPTSPEGRRLLMQQAAMSGAIGGAFGATGPVLRSSLGREALAAGGAGLAGATAAELAGEDPEKGALLGMGAYGAARLGSAAARKAGFRTPDVPVNAMTRDVPAGTRLFHGTPVEFEGMPTRGEGALGRGPYFTSDASVASQYAKVGAQDGPQRIYPVETPRSMQFLEREEPIEPGELARLFLQMTPEEQAAIAADGVRMPVDITATLTRLHGPDAARRWNEILEQADFAGESGRAFSAFEDNAYSVRLNDPQAVRSAFEAPSLVEGGTRSALRPVGESLGAGLGAAALEDGSPEERLQAGLGAALSSAVTKGSGLRMMADAVPGVVNAVPTQRQQAQVQLAMDEFADSARVQVDSPRRAQQALNSIPYVRKLAQFIDPAAKMWNTQGGKDVLTSVLAAANYLRMRGLGRGGKMTEMWDALASLHGDAPIIKAGPLRASGGDLKRAGAQLSSAAAPVAAGYVAEQETGNDALFELGVLGGAFAMGASSAIQGKKRFNFKPLQNVQVKNPWQEPLVAHIKDDPYRKFLDVLQNPWRWDLSPEQQAGVQQYLKLHDEMITETNAFLAAAGEDLIPTRSAHGILQWFTRDSVEKVLGKDKAKAFEVLTPGFLRDKTPQHTRELGPVYAAAWRKHPGLEEIDNPQKLLAHEQLMHDQIRAAAIVTAQLKKSGGAVSVNGLTSKQRASYEAQGYSPIPGVKDTLFPNDTVDAVAALLVPSRGRREGAQGAIFSFLDVTTNAIRQSMFTADLSAWTMQGAIAALEDPVGTLRNAHHLVGATVLGDRYLNWWIERNPDVWRAASKAGYVSGFEQEGLEKATPSLARLPGFRRVEAHGFEAFLPIHRALMWDNIRRGESLVEAMGLGHKGTADVGQLTNEVIRNAPLYGAAAAVATGNVPEFTDDERLDEVMLMALGFSASAAYRRAFYEPLGDAVAKSVSRKSRLAAEARAGKQVNRVSGVMNKQQLGITSEQSLVERTIFARSPALTRNTLILAKHALTDFGPEGAMARMYLAKTGFTMAAGLYVLKHELTGEWDSLDFQDPDSFLHPTGFLKLNAGAGGTLSASNPNIALARAVLKQEFRDDERNVWRFEHWIPYVGLGDWYAARTPDVFGQFTSPYLSSFERDTDGGPAPLSKQAIAQRGLPLSVQALQETGLIAQTEIGGSGPVQNAFEDLGLPVNEAYSNERERTIGVLGGIGGFNTTPESLAAERVRLRREKTQALFPRGEDRTGDGQFDYDDLNSKQQAQVREALERDSDYADLTRRVNESGADEEQSPVDHFIEGQRRINDAFAEVVGEASDEWEAGRMTGVQFKELYQRESTRRRTRMEELRESVGTMSADRRGTDETVEEYLARNLKPEDQAVSDYYGLFDAATDQFGETDWEMLEKLQQDFLAELPRSQRKYVEARLAEYDKPSTIAAVAAYQAAQDAIQPYFDIGDNTFRDFRGRSRVLSQFGSPDELQTALELSAAQQGISYQNLVSALRNTDYGFDRYMEEKSRRQQLFRRMNKDVDAALIEWHGFSPLSPAFKARTPRRASQFRGRSNAMAFLNGGV